MKCNGLISKDSVGKAYGPVGMYSKIEQIDDINNFMLQYA